MRKKIVSFLSVLITLLLLVGSLFPTSTQAEVDPCWNAKVIETGVRGRLEGTTYSLSGLIITMLNSANATIDIDDDTLELIREDIKAWNYYASWCTRKTLYKQIAPFYFFRFNGKAAANFSANGPFRLTGDANGYLYLDTPGVQISNGGCSQTYDALSKVQMGIDADANISYQDANWTITGFHSVGASSLAWNFSVSSGSSCDGNWSGTSLLVDAQGSTLNLLTNTIYSLVHLGGATYLLPIDIESDNSGIQLILGGAIIVPWLSNEAASNLNITLGTIDTEQGTIILNKLSVIDPVSGATGIYDIVLSYNVNTDPISFELVSAVPN